MSMIKLIGSDSVVGKDNELVDGMVLSSTWSSKHHRSVLHATYISQCSRLVLMFCCGHSASKTAFPSIWLIIPCGDNNVTTSEC